MESQSVRVAVNIRSHLSEHFGGSTGSITVHPVAKQVQIGFDVFTFDYIFGSLGSPSSSIFDECVAPLVDALFHGYNGTVLAYGQSGAGKTYTMGTNYNGKGQTNGVIPKVMDAIFSRVEMMKESTEFSIKVSFIEILKEKVFDLLGPKTARIARVPIKVRESASGGILLEGIRGVEVRTKEEMTSQLMQGSLSHATGSTNMNSQSSRSHAIFTISMGQRRTTHSSARDDALFAKLHLVDLAGSKRAEQSGADGSKLKEGSNINKELLVLGKVINALANDRRKIGVHVPYRDSKLTRILQDSLGGNSKTVMIACVSAAEIDVKESLNTLRYASHARNIKNKAIVNRDLVTTGMTTQNIASCTTCREKDREMTNLKERIASLEREVKKLREELALERQSKELETSPKTPIYNSRKRGHDLLLKGDEEQHTSDDQESSVPSYDDTEWQRTKIRRGLYKSRINIGAGTSTSFGEVCCTCSKNSSCKTKKCQCRINGYSCSVSCSCGVARCSNRRVT